jgi:hypothetical protein
MTASKISHATIADLATTPMPAVEALEPAPVDPKGIADYASIFRKPAADVLQPYLGSVTYSRLWEEKRLRILAIGQQYGIPSESRFPPLLPGSLGKAPRCWIDDAPLEARQLIEALMKENPKWAKTLTAEDKISKRGPGRDSTAQANRKEAFLEAHRRKAITGCSIGEADEYLAEKAPDQFGDTKNAVSSKRNLGGKLLDPKNIAAQRGSAAFILAHYRTMYPVRVMADFPPDAPLTVINSAKRNDESALGYALGEAITKSGGMVDHLTLEDLPAPQLAALQAAAKGGPQSFTIFDYTAGNGGQADALHTALGEYPLRLDVAILKPDSERLARFLRLLGIMRDMLKALGKPFSDANEAFRAETNKSAPADACGIARELAETLERIQDIAPLVAPLARARSLAKTPGLQAAPVELVIDRCTESASAYASFWDGRAPGVYLLAHQCKPPGQILESVTVFPQYETRERSAVIQQAELEIAARERAEKEREEQRAEQLERMLNPQPLGFGNVYSGTGILGGGLFAALAPSGDKQASGS